VISWIPPDPCLPDGSLSGITVGIKDNIEVAGVRSTCGSAFFADRVSAEDAVVIRHLRAAGADIVATLNQAEFAVGVTSQNSASGGSGNPWDVRRVPGGSSGGSGAGVASGLVDVALGTDTGGSVRLPASACGVTGLRPSLGLIDTAGVYPVSPQFDTVGPLARTTDMVERVFAVLAGSEHLASDAPAPSRVGVPDHFVTTDIDPAISSAVCAFVEQLRKLGLVVVPVEIPYADRAQDHVYTLLYSDLVELHRVRLDMEPERFQPATLERIRLGLAITAADRREAEVGRDQYRRALSAVFEYVDVVVTPTLPVDVPLRRKSAIVVGQSRRMGQLSYPWSLHDGPTLSLPIGFHPKSGMPIGAQVTAARCDEQALFHIGKAYQTATDWHERRPLISM